MANKNAQLTRDGYERLKAELAQLKERRVTTIDEVKTAREYGDLKENGEYHAAREAYGWLEGQIRALEAKLDGAEILPDGIEYTEVVLGVPITVRKEATGEVLHFTIVDAAEIEYVDNGISEESPLGAGLLGWPVGDQAEVETAAGLAYYTILKVGE